MKKTMILAVLTFFTSAGMKTMAQVTIGDEIYPQTFSVLELISNQQRGLRLPQMTTQKRDSITNSTGFKTNALAEGLQIFNIDNKCVETWNGKKWLSVCDPCAGNTPAGAPTVTNTNVSFCYNDGAKNLVTASGATTDSGLTLVWYDAPTDGNVMDANSISTTTVMPGNSIFYYVTQQNSLGCENTAARVQIIVTITDCSIADANSITSTDSYCLLCETSDTIKFKANAAIANPVFRIYADNSTTAPIATVVGTTGGYKVPASSLGIDYSANKQGGYTTYWVSVSGNNYKENLPANRKQITVSGSQLPEFAPYNLGANPLYDTPKKQMQYLAEVQSSETDGNVYGGRFQWGREWLNTDNTTSYQVTVDFPNNYVLFQGTQRASILAVDGSATYNPSTGQIISYGSTDTGNTASGQYIYDPSKVSGNDWRVVPNDSLWGNGKKIGTVMAGTQGTGTGVLYTNGSWYQSPVPVAQYESNDPCRKLNAGGKSWRLPTQDEWERLSDYDCNPTNQSGSFSIATNTPYNTTKGYTVVPVAGGKVSTDFAAPSAAHMSGGHAIYKTSVWNAAIAPGGYFDQSSSGTPNMTLSLYDPAAPEPLLFFPTAGYRSGVQATLHGVGQYSSYWSSTLYNYGILSFGGSYSGFGAISGGSPAFGLCVRCVAKQD